MIPQDYKKFYHRAMRTALIAHEKSTNKVYHIFSVIELLPKDIPDYNIPKNDWYYNKEHPITYSKRSEISCDLFTFSIIIQEFSLIDYAIEIFENPTFNNCIDGEINYFFNRNFYREPSGISPLHIPSNIHKTEGIESVIPQRISGLNVWAQIDSERLVEKQFRRESLSPEMKAISQLSEDWLGFNIWEKSEHIGNIYLAAPNPYYRDIDIALSTNPIGIFYHFKLRKGIKEKFKIRIIDKRGDNIALDKMYQIKDSIGLIELPHEPHLTEIRIYDLSDNLIGIKGPFTFIKSIHIGMSMKQADFHVKVQDKDGIKEHKIEKYSKEKPSHIGKPSDFNSAYYFKNAEKSRQHVMNKENSVFIFFKGVKNENDSEKESQRNEAKTIIRNLINKAQFRCFICDPYFSLNDLIDFAFYIQNSSVQLNIMNAKEFIDKTMAKNLTDAIFQYNQKPFQKIECRILKGDKSILHDRFIISDNTVWFIGTSLNHIGTKATCIGKVPESDNIEIISEIENWFYNKNDSFSESIEDYAS